MGLNIREEIKKSKTSNEGLVGLYKEVQKISGSSGSKKSVRDKIKEEKKRITQLKEDSLSREELMVLRKERKHLEKEKRNKRFEKLSGFIKL